MTEQEWLTCTDPKKMLAFLGGEADDRRLRLFAVSYCRRIWFSTADERVTKAVEVAEKYADGLATDEEREEAQRAASTVRLLGGISARWAASLIARKAAMLMIHAVGRRAARPPGQDYDPLNWYVEKQEQCKLLCDIFGNPFRSVTISPAWLTWNEGTVVKLAQAIYDDRAFDRMPILADALEEAGCINQDVLSHCRQSGEHVRGCWVVDLILGKE